jgi:small subunit ribosomal protein S13
VSPPERRPGPCPPYDDLPSAGRRTGERQGRDAHDTFEERKVNRLMARLVGVDLPRDKRVEVALTYIYGIGKTRAQALLTATGVNPDMRVHELGDEELVKLRDHIEANFQVEGDLRREVSADIRRKVEIGSYQGRRHRQGLPVRGQRTKTNARTRKGPKRTVAGKKKAGK